MYAERLAAGNAEPISRDEYESYGTRKSYDDAFDHALLKFNGRIRFGRRWSDLSKALSTGSDQIAIPNELSQRLLGAREIEPRLRRLGCES